MAADVGGHVNENQSRPGPHKPVFQTRQANALENEKLRDDVQKSRHHQGEKVNPKELFPAQEGNTGEAVGGKGGYEHGQDHRQAGVDDAVADGHRENVHIQNVLVGREVQPGRQELWGIGKHIAEFLKGIGDHKEEGHGKHQQRPDEQHPQQGLTQNFRTFFAFHAYPSWSTLSSRKTRFRTTVKTTMVTAEIMPMAEASPNWN